MNNGTEEQHIHTSLLDVEPRARRFISVGRKYAHADEELASNGSGSVLVDI